jgi:hypothetical protein
MKKHLLFSCMMLASTMFFSSCGEKVAEQIQPQQETTSKNENGFVELSANTKVVNADINNSLRGISESSLTFEANNAFFDKIKAGDILVAAPNEIAPDGYLRTVIRVEKNGNSYVFHTQQAKIEEAVKNANIHIETPLRFNPEKNTAKTADNFSQNFSQSIGLNWIIYDRDGNNSTTIDQIRTSGSLTLSAGMFLSMQIQNNQLRYFYTSTNFNARHDQSIIVGGSVNVSGSTRVYNQPLPNVTFTVGVLPITVKPTMEVFLGYQGTANASVTFGYTGQATAAPNIKFENGAWSYGFSRSISATRKPLSTNVSATLTGSIKPKVTFALYGCTCASAYIQGEVYVTLTVPSSAPLRAGIKGGAGANLFGYAPSNNAIFNLPIGI